MIARPNDLDLAFEYAKLSSEAGDYEGAISTLERMLIYAPNTPRLQLELGVLYYRIGANDVARNYFEQALANRNVPPEVAQQIKLYLQQLSLTADPPPFSATIFSAIRWESNANSGPGTQSITLTASTSPSTSPGWPEMRATTAADTNFILAKVSGRKTQFAGKTIGAKGQRWPYGIQPCGRYSDQPFIRELYYNGAHCQGRPEASAGAGHHASSRPTATRWCSRAPPRRHLPQRRSMSGRTSGSASRLSCPLSERERPTR
jgi:hypothetical protein